MSIHVSWVSKLNIPCTTYITNTKNILSKAQCLVPECYTSKFRPLSQDLLGCNGKKSEIGETIKAFKKAVSIPLQAYGSYIAAKKGVHYGLTPSELLGYKDLAVNFKNYCMNSIKFKVNHYSRKMHLNRIKNQVVNHFSFSKSSGITS